MEKQAVIFMSIFWGMILTFISITLSSLLRHQKKEK